MSVEAGWKNERFGKPFASERAKEARSGILHSTSKNIQHLQYMPFKQVCFSLSFRNSRQSEQVSTVLASQNFLYICIFICDTKKR